MTIKIHTFSNSPALAFEEGGLLAGFDAEGADYSTDRAQALFGALNIERLDVSGDSEYSLGSLPDGRWALVGPTVEGHRFAIDGGATPLWTYEGYWAVVLGDDRTARDVVRECELDASDRAGLDEWLVKAEIESWSVGHGSHDRDALAAAWGDFHGRALAELSAVSTITAADARARFVAANSAGRGYAPYTDAPGPNTIEGAVEAAEADGWNVVIRGTAGDDVTVLENAEGELMGIADAGGPWAVDLGKA